MARPHLRQRRLLSRRTSPRQQSLEIKRDHGCVEALHWSPEPKGWARRAGCFYWRGRTAKGLIFFCEPSALLLLPRYHTVTLFAALDLKKKNILDTPHATWLSADSIP